MHASKLIRISLLLVLASPPSPTSWLQELYDQDVGNEPPESPSTNNSTYVAEDGHGLKPGQLAAAIVVPVLVVLAAVAVLAYLVLHGRKNAGCDIMGRVSWKRG